MKFIRPVPGPVRGSDSYGSGHFAAPRGGRLHRGIDLVAEPGDPVMSPVDGIVDRLGICYPHDDYRLVQIAASERGLIVRLLYVDPDVAPGDPVNAGQVIGHVQDLTRRYPADARHANAITPHVHFEVGLLPRSGVLMSRWIAPQRTGWMNPEILLAIGSCA